MRFLYFIKTKKKQQKKNNGKNAVENRETEKFI